MAKATKAKKPAPKVLKTMYAASCMEPKQLKNIVHDNVCTAYESLAAAEKAAKEMCRERAFEISDYNEKGKAHACVMEIRVVKHLSADAPQLTKIEVLSEEVK